jgi:hypothetical protein
MSSRRRHRSEPSAVAEVDSGHLSREVDEQGASKRHHTALEKVPGRSTWPPGPMMRCLSTTTAKNTRVPRSPRRVRGGRPRAATGSTFRWSYLEVHSRPAQPFCSALSSDSLCRMRSRWHLDLLRCSQPGMGCRERAPRPRQTHPAFSRGRLCAFATACTPCEHHRRPACCGG